MPTARLISSVDGHENLERLASSLFFMMKAVLTALMCSLVSGRPTKGATTCTSKSKRSRRGSLDSSACEPRTTYLDRLLHKITGGMRQRTRGREARGAWL